MTDDFQIGQRVVLSDAGKRHFECDKNKFNHGTVVGMCRSPALIKIRPDGYKTVRAFAKIFWKADRAAWLQCAPFVLHTEFEITASTIRCEGVRPLEIKTRTKLKKMSVLFRRGEHPLTLGHVSLEDLQEAVRCAVNLTTPAGVDWLRIPLHVMPNANFLSDMIFEPQTFNASIEYPKPPKISESLTAYLVLSCQEWPAL